MRYKAQVGASLFAVTILAAGISSAHADVNPATDEPSAGVVELSADDFVFAPDGSVVEGDFQELTATVYEPNPEAPTGPSVRSCPEVNDPAKVTYTGSPHFVVDSEEPFSSWLSPNQTATYTTESAHEISAEVELGTEAEVSGVVAKAKETLKIKAGAKISVKRALQVSDSNKTNKAYRVRLGSMGWKITRTKEWIAAPCTPKKKVTYKVNAPQVGDITLGRFNS
ncbi:hypothetical protein [Actinoplanes sp. NPDC026623]|uniref:hypothetical protein n=1 Tax=Actinoplanes sp. NPDC026623 TaxID=3155610 RepID=UPI0033E71B71